MAFMKFFREFWENLVRVSAQLFQEFFLAMIWQVLPFFIPLNIWLERISLE